MAKQNINIGTVANDGTGDPLRDALDKVNDNFTEVYDQSFLYEAISGGAGFVNVSGDVVLDLSTSRIFHIQLTGNVSSLTYINIPDASVYGADWRIVLRVDGSGPYTLAGWAATTWEDASSTDDLNLEANASNTIQQWTEGATLKGIIVSTGTVELEAREMNFQEDGTISAPITRSESMDFSNVSNLEADGTAGTGTLSFKKSNGADLSTAAIDNPISFVAGDVVNVILTGSTTPTAVSIPRFAE